MRGEESAEHADGSFERIHILILIIVELALEPESGITELRCQVHNCHDVEPVDDDPTETFGAHVGPSFGDGVESIKACYSKLELFP